MMLKSRIEKSNDMGAYSLLTNNYCLLSEAAAPQLRKEVCRSFKHLYLNEAGPEDSTRPVVKCSVGGTQLIGRFCLGKHLPPLTSSVGNSNGLVLPSMVTDDEVAHLRSTLPGHVQIRKLASNACLGNMVVCNDEIALVPAELQLDSEVLSQIERVLSVDILRSNQALPAMLGTQSALNSKGMLLSPELPKTAVTEVHDLLGEDIVVKQSSVNRGSAHVGAGLAANDKFFITGKNFKSALTVIGTYTTRCEGDAALEALYSH